MITKFFHTMVYCETYIIATLLKIGQNPIPQSRSSSHRVTFNMKPKPSTGGQFCRGSKGYILMRDAGKFCFKRPSDASIGTCYYDLLLIMNMEQSWPDRWYIMTKKGMFAKRKSATHQHLSGYPWAADVALIWRLLVLLDFCWGNNCVKLICSQRFHANRCGVALLGCKQTKGPINRLAGYAIVAPSGITFIYKAMLFICLQHRISQPVIPISTRDVSNDFLHYRLIWQSFAWLIVESIKYQKKCEKCTFPRAQSDVFKTQRLFITNDKEKQQMFYNLLENDWNDESITKWLQLYIIQNDNEACTGAKGEHSPKKRAILCVRKSAQSQWIFKGGFF